MSTVEEQSENGSTSVSNDQQESMNKTEQLFQSLKLKSFEGLDEVKREVCPGCNCSRQLYCHVCFCYVGDETLFPTVHLPIDLEIVHHPKEKLSKSTIPQAMVIADNAHVYEYNQVELDFNEEDTVILYPGENAMDIADLDLDTVKKVVVVDGTWSQAGTMSRDPALTKLKQVKIGQYETMFWRHQRKGKDHLATIEAIYYFYRELYTSINMKASDGLKGYQGEADNLLFFFVYKFQRVQNEYTKGKFHDREFKKIDNYIKQEEGETETEKETNTE